MPKGRHAKDKLWLTPTERMEPGQGGYQGKTEISRMHVLPFDCCALTLQTAVAPVVTPDGYVFDSSNIIKFIKTFGKHPATGEPLKLGQLKPIHFTRNKDDDIICPVTQKVFNQHSHIVVNINNGMVYSYEAIKEICINLKNNKDPMDGGTLSVSNDILDIQNPNKPRKAIDKEVFFNNLELLDIKGLADRPDEVAKTMKMAGVAPSPMQEKVNLLIDKGGGRGLLAQHRAMKKTSQLASTGTSVMSTVHTTGNVGASLTSTAASIETTVQYREMTQQEIYNKLYMRMKKEKLKGFAKIETTLGSLSMTLHCDKAPITCHNFILLAKKGYYKNHDIHRIIPSFCMQTGDPDGDGSGGDSAFGGPIRDEFHPDLNHVGKGVVGMANKGPGTNTSQFYITFASASHLDKVHTVFAQIVSGLNILDEIEKVPQKKGRPRQGFVPKVIDIHIFKDPYDEDPVDDKEEEKAEKTIVNQSTEMMIKSMADAEMGVSLNKRTKELTNSQIKKTKYDTKV